MLGVFPSLDGSMRQQPMPPQIRLEASSFCQLRCPSCPTTTGDIHPAVGSGFLRFDNFRQVVDENPSLRRLELSNFGEVLLSPHLLKILEYASAKGVAITLSNGINFNHATDELLEALVKYRVREISCSIDGASPETYRRYRVRGNFDNVIRHIERINHFKSEYRSKFPQLTWQFVVFGHNEHELPVAREMATKLGMEFYPKIGWDQKFSPIRDAEFVRAQTGERAVTREEYEELYGRQYLSSICHQLWDDPQINWNGKNLGCCRNFWGDFGGNAFTDGLRACFNHEKMRYARAMLHGRKPARDDIPCSTCEIYLSMRRHSNWVERDSWRGRLRQPVSYARHLVKAGITAVALRISDDPQYWRNRAENARLLAATNGAVTKTKMMSGVAKSYEKIAKWLEERADRRF